MYAAETNLLRRISNTTNTSRLTLKHCPCWNAVTRFPANQEANQQQRFNAQKHSVSHTHARARTHTHYTHTHTTHTHPTHTTHTHTHTHTTHTHTHYTHTHTHTTHTHIHTHSQPHRETGDKFAGCRSQSQLCLYFLLKISGTWCRLMTLPSTRHPNLFE